MTAPYCQHPRFERAVLEASAPTWDPSPAVIRFLGEGELGNQEVLDLREWIAETHRRGLCSRCGKPIEWTTQRRWTHSDKCRKQRSRARRKLEFEARSFLTPDERAHFDRLGRKERHERALAILRGKYPKPKKPRLGHAAGAKRPDEDHGEGLDVNSSLTFGSKDSMRYHEHASLQDPGDKQANQWLKDHGYGPDGNPL